MQNVLSSKTQLFKEKNILYTYFIKKFDFLFNFSQGNNALGPKLTIYSKLL